MDKVRREFMWGKSGKESRGISLINWETVCLPKGRGGFGVPQLENRNITLLLRWWWKAYAEPEALWTIVVTQIRWVEMYPHGPRLWAVSGSFFWRQLVNIKKIFHWCTYWIIGDGAAISFWYDTWNGYPLAGITNEEARPTQPKISLRDAAPILDLLAPQLTQENIHFSNDRYSLVWRWQQNGLYSAKSAYYAMVGGGKVKWRFKEIWECKTPPTVKIFTFLMLKEKILTHDVMERRGIHVDQKCLMCRNCPRESALHLLFLCPYAVTVWSLTSIALGYQLMVPDVSMQHIRTSSCERLTRAGTNMKIRWASAFCCTVWHLWKQQNEMVFGGTLLPPPRLSERIVQECHMWKKFAYVIWG